MSDRCQHHYVLDTPSGSPTCYGKCKKCGHDKDTFRTSTEDWTFVPDGKHKNITVGGQFTSETGKRANQKSQAWRESL